MYFYGIDYTYLIYVMPALILSIIAQALVKGRFSRFDKVSSNKGITGAQAAALLLKKNDIYDVKIQHIHGNLTDNYNPSTKVLSLSDSTYFSTSIAAIGVAAHETGHAIQHATQYGPLYLRSTLVPVANFGSRTGPFLVAAGLIFAQFSRFTQYIPIFQLLSDIGLLLFAASVLFYIVTLPVEFNASRRALAVLRETNTLDSKELNGARKVLTAAAMTYVASALTAIGTLIRLFVISGRGKKRD